MASAGRGGGGKHGPPAPLCVVAVVSGLSLGRVAVGVASGVAWGAGRAAHRVLHGFKHSQSRQALRYQDDTTLTKLSKHKLVFSSFE